MESCEIAWMWRRTLGCCQQGGAVGRRATTLEDIVGEKGTASTRERQGRLLDAEQAGCVEEKKREGYF